MRCSDDERAGAHTRADEVAMSLPKMFHLSCSVGLAAVLLAAVPPGRIATADNVVGIAPPGSLNAATGEGAFRHLQALQDIATANGGNRAAGAAGVVSMNEGNESNRTDGFSGTLSKAVPIPVVGIPFQLGRALDSTARADGGTVRLAVDAVTGKRPTRNVLADTAASGIGPLIFV